jgi:hypothetical protein
MSLSLTFSLSYAASCIVDDPTDIFFMVPYTVESLYSLTKLILFVTLTSFLILIWRYGKLRGQGFNFICMCEVYVKLHLIKRYFSL